MDPIKGGDKWFSEGLLQEIRSWGNIRKCKRQSKAKEGGTHWKTGIILPEKDLIARHTEVLSKTSLQWGAHSKHRQGLLELPMEVQLSPKKTLSNCTSGGKGRDFPSAMAVLFFFHFPPGWVWILHKIGPLDNFAHKISDLKHQSLASSGQWIPALTCWDRGEHCCSQRERGIL